ncbi:hypothetical protein KNE206_30060 [Kitasatospora sp. NE20-6]|uniref:hypothetical protein n=1 Tax=Kitasatospora sp. NE20-6 TaxID=2859066 RepID=UPI0034DBC954
MTYTVQGFLSFDDMEAKRPALTEVFRTEPGETYTAKIRAEARRRRLAYHRAGEPDYTHITCRYTPDA